MQVESCYLLGYISKAHGIKGEVKAVYDVDRIEEYEEQESVYVLLHGKLTPFFMERIRIVNHREVVIQFRGIYDRDAAEELVKCELYMPLDTLPELSDTGFYYHDVVGYRVRDEQLGLLGTVRLIREMPGNDILFMDYEDKEVLIPVTDHIVLRADHEAREIITALPEGLLDIYLT